MSGDDYPLRALLRLRDEIKRRREKELAAALGAQQAAAARLAAADGAVERAASALATQREATARRRGTAPAATLQRTASFLRGLEQQLTARWREREASAALHEARLAETRRARSLFAEALRQAEVIQREFDRWSRARQQEAQRRAEQELEELAGRGGGGGLE